MQSVQERIKELNAGVEYDSMEFYKAAVLGQQVYAVVLYAYLFLTVDQECGKLVQQIPKEKLLRRYLHEMDADDVWTAQTSGILHKMRRSFAILGLHYQTFGYDSVYSIFKTAADTFFDAFLLRPVTDNTHFLESYAWQYRHVKISYKVREIQRFSEKDKLFQATTVFLGEKYVEVGYSPKNAIENLAAEIVNTSIPEEWYRTVAKSQNIEKIERKSFVFDAPDPPKLDGEIQRFSEKYGVEPFLMHFALLSRSQMGKQVWERFGITPPEVLLQTKASHLKRALIFLGQEIILLQLLNFNLKKLSWNGIDFRTLDPTVLNIASYEIHERLLKMLRITDITEEIFDAMKTPLKGDLSQKEKNQIADGIIAVFFLSNFAPDKKFDQYFGESIASVYEKVGLDVEVDEHVATIAFLSALGIREKTNCYEIGNGMFHVELRLGSGRNAPAYNCENESTKIAKRAVWKEAYEDIGKLRQFFISADSNCTDAVLQLFVKGIRDAQIIRNEFYLDFGILNARNFPEIDRSAASKIMDRLKVIVNEHILDEFLEVIYKANKDLYVEVEGAIFRYTDWLKSVALNQETVLPLEINEVQIEQIYGSIVNPQFSTQKKLIDSDYKFVNRIYPLSDDIAKYAIGKNMDAYNYLPFVSAETETFFQTRKREEEELSNLGALDLKADADTKIMILDSHKPVHTQIQSLVEDFKIDRVTIACGYCFASGLSLMEALIKDMILSGIPLELHIGALQKYDGADLEHMITGIDKTTIRILNTFLTNDNFSLFTCPDRFYHGKLYIFEGTETSLICMGSSNVSRAAFITNYELNIAFKTKTDSELYKGFALWIKQLRYHSKEIKHLEESAFGENEIKQDGSVQFTRVSLDSMRNRIRALSNFEVQYRLNLWMSYAPDLITENLGIPSLSDYFVFVYKREQLLVFESFQAGNAYFCIRYEDSFEDVIHHIAAFSKTEIFEYSRMSKRGYHVQNKFTLETNIGSYFRTGKN